jgi:hypothetical protein
LEVALKHSFELKCEYNGPGDVEFLEWFKKNATHDVSVNTDKPGHYIVKHHEKDSILLIKIFGKTTEKFLLKSVFFSVNADANVTQWYVKTKNELPACQFGQISRK